MSDSRRTALVLAHEPDGPAGQIGVRLTERGFDVHTHVITDDYAEPQRFTPWPPFDHFDLVVVMGSVRYLTKKHEISSWIHDEVADVRRTIEAERPVLGICFGGQVIADAMGGSVDSSGVYTTPSHVSGQARIEARIESREALSPERPGRQRGRDAEMPRSSPLRAPGDRSHLRGAG